MSNWKNKLGNFMWLRLTKFKRNGVNGFKLVENVYFGENWCKYGDLRWI